jgi:hypothetical protein
MSKRYCNKCGRELTFVSQEGRLTGVDYSKQFVCLTCKDGLK